MIVPFRSFFGVCALAFAFSTTACQSNSNHAMSESEMTAKWMEYSTPGDAHKTMAYKEGTWDMKVKSFMAPGAPCQESTGTSVVKWVMDGRFLEDNTTSSMGGMPFTGHGMSGFDNLTKRYTSVWCDSMGTGIVQSEGTYDAKSKTINYASHMPDFATGEYTNARMVETKKDNDHWMFQMYCPDVNGDEYMSMQIEYTRAK